VNSNTSQSVYLSYSGKTSPTRSRIIEFLTSELGEVIDPRDYPTPAHTGCLECMEKVMKGLLFPLIEKCNALAVWDKGRSCRMGCELFYAALLGKNLYYIEVSPGGIDYDELTLQEYYTLARLPDLLKGLEEDRI